MPSMFVRTNAPGPWMLRSTWLSAAKWTMARGRCCDSRVSTSARSQMSPRTKTSRAVLCERLEVLQIPCIGQAVKHDDLFVGHSKPVEYEVTADETRAAGYDDHRSAFLYGRKRFILIANGSRTSEPPNVSRGPAGA